MVIFGPPFLTFVIVGLWHDATLGLLIFGALHGLGIGWLAFLDKALDPRKNWVKSWRRGIVGRVMGVALTYSYVSFTLVFFALGGSKLTIFFARFFG